MITSCSTCRKHKTFMLNLYGDVECPLPFLHIKLSKKLKVVWGKIVTDLTLLLNSFLFFCSLSFFRRELHSIQAFFFTYHSSGKTPRRSCCTSIHPRCLQALQVQSIGDSKKNRPQPTLFVSPVLPIQPNWMNIWKHQRKRFKIAVFMLNSWYQRLYMSPALLPKSGQIAKVFGQSAPAEWSAHLSWG